MEAAMRRYAELGVHTLKTGYAGGFKGGYLHHSQYGVQHYQRVVETAAKYRIMLDVHKPIKETGIRRTWPNMMTREGARGMEWNAWSEGNSAEYLTTLPFVRMLSGPMDYTPGIFDIDYSTAKADKGRIEWNGPNAECCIKTTLARQIANWVIIYSPLQMAADLIENYEGHPAFRFFRDFDADCDWSKALQGEIGDYIVVARRAKDRYFLGAGTDEKARTLVQKLDFLEPGVTYTATIYADAPDAGRNPEAYLIGKLYLDPEGLEQSWNASEFAYGTNDWTEVYLDFVPDRQGEAVVCCGLGFPWGTYNGGKASGTVWYDNVKVTPAPEEALYTREGEHIVLKLDRDKVTVSDADIDAWLSKLDRTYEAYRDLVGDVPFDGRKIMILNTPGIEPGYWALAGNPILWNSHVAVSKLLDRTVEFGDWGFGIIHEIGHVFSQGNISGTGRWNWNDEIFANFRMSYALEACDGTMSQRDICYRGADVINYYKIFYDETIGAGIPKNNGDALHYTFLRIKERYGWDVYKKAFRELYALGDSGQEGLETPYDKFLFFLSYVSKAAGEDVVAATYTPGELALIEESLRN